MSITADSSVIPMDYAGRRVVVGGAGISGIAVTKALLIEQADVTVVDQKETAYLNELANLGAHIMIAPNELPSDVDDFIVSPGWTPQNPLIRQAIADNIPVYSEPELAWRLANRQPTPVPWLAVTGTNGKTTTVTMLASMLSAAGLRSIAAGNVGYPLINAVLAKEPYDVLAVELSSFQLHWSNTLAPAKCALLNLADDHLDWHGDFKAYKQAKESIWRGVGSPGGVAVINADDPLVEPTRQNLPATATKVTFTLNEPKPGQLGVRDGVLLDRAFGSTEVQLANVDTVRPAGLHNVANALAAAALARSHGVSPQAIAQGLRNYQPERHRNELVATINGIQFINDTKATNPHAARAALLSYDRVIWLAGGLLKGVEVDQLVQEIAPRLSGAVIFGADRAKILQALTRHAPQLPVIEIVQRDDKAMREIVNAAIKLAQPGDTVLLAPAAASFDMFANYPARGEAFITAVTALRNES